jgi:transcriptional regulator with XRE-family HTH domain/DNA-binding CsgD family transcriptional regulator
MARRGRPPDHKRREQLAKLRARGLTFRQIGQRLGVSRQCIHALLKRTNSEDLGCVVCCACRRQIVRWQGTKPRSVWCLSCLDSEVPFSEHLRSHRVATGLTTRALAAQTGLSMSSISAYEGGVQQPSRPSFAKLLQVLPELPTHGLMLGPGNTPDIDRQRRAAQLRAAGLTLQKIADRLGCSSQRAHEILGHQENARLVPICCQECGRKITRLRIAVECNRSAWCLACLVKHPEATFGQRLKAHRLAAGLTISGLEKRSGVSALSLSRYERDRGEPTRPTLAKLIRALGMK